MIFSNGEDILFIKNDCSEIKINGISYAVKHTDLFTEEKGRIFTEKHEIKYSKGMCYIYDTTGVKNKKLIMTLNDLEKTNGDFHSEVMLSESIKDKPVYRATEFHIKEKNTRKFLISKFLPPLILEETADMVIIKIENQDDYHKFPVTKIGNHRKGLMAYESDNKKHKLIISTVKGIHSTYNGNYISEIF